MPDATEDTITKSLKARYWAIIRSEDYPRTPKISSELDEIERLILNPKAIDDAWKAIQAS